MKLSQLQHVTAIVNRGSLRKAARELGLAQPVLSRSIQELEKELGLDLFNRSRLGMTLTPAGQVFFRRAEAVQRELQRTVEEIENLKGVAVGKISVGMSTAALVGILPKIVTTFRRRFPHVRLDISESLFPTIENDIREGLIDLYIGPVPPDYSDRSLSIDLLFQNKRIIVGRRGHPLANARSIKDLVGTEWVTTPVLPNIESEVITLFTSANLPPPTIVAQAGSGLSIVAMVVSSDLLAPLPCQWLDFIELTGLLQQIPVTEVPDAPAICCVRRSTLPLPPAAEYFSDLVARVAANYDRKLKNLDH